MEMMIDVVSPLGSVSPGLSDLTRRPLDLSDKTVAFIWNHVFRGDEIFPIVQEELEGYFRGIRFLPFSLFGNIHGLDERAVLAALPDRLREFRVDAALVGVGN